jgi:hypothetical protein
VWDDTWIEGCGLVIRSGHMPYWYGKSLTAVVANYQLPVRAFARLTPRRASRRLATSPLPRSIVTTTQLLTGSALAGALALGLYGFVATRRAENGLREREGEIARLRERVEGLESKVTALQSVRTLLQAMQENKGAEATTRGAVTTPKNPPTPMLNPAPSSTASSTAGTTPRASESKAGFDSAARQAFLERNRFRYAVFFKTRNLTDQQAERMLSLLAEQESTRRDLQQMVQDQGVAGDSQAVEALRSKLNEPITKELRWLLGEDGYADYSAFQKALYYRSAHVDPLAPLFTAARVPLSEAQVAQLVTIVAANNQSVRRGKSDITATSQVNWSGVLQQAGGVLSPEQMQVMQKIAAGKAPKP